MVKGECRTKAIKLVWACAYGRVTRLDKWSHYHHWASDGLWPPHFPGSRLLWLQCHPRMMRTSHGVQILHRSRSRKTSLWRCRVGHCSKWTANFFAMTARAVRPDSWSGATSGLERLRYVSEAAINHAPMSCTEALIHVQIHPASHFHHHRQPGCSAEVDTRTVH